jgi:tripeptide aminopeptidase
VYSEQLYHTLVDIVRIPSTSGHEEQVREFLAQQLTQLGLTYNTDASGNLITTLPGERGKPLLLNAHMDRVPPGLGHQPVLRDGVLYSDGTTNLGADDAAGITIILEVLRRIFEHHLPHPPLVIVFTVQEEAGLCGASGFDSTAWNVEDGIVFDNAFEAGVVVSQGATYEAFDVHITGHTGHPGKDLSHTVNAIEIFHAANYPHGSLDDDQTRINIGRISGGSARNAIPDTVTVSGELRSFASPAIQEKHKQAIQSAFAQAASRFSGHASVAFTTHSSGYKIDTNEPLLDTYRNVLSNRGATLELHPTFIGSDTSGFRPAIKAFTISTGVSKEHTSEEYVALAPLEQLVQDTLSILKERG